MFDWLGQSLDWVKNRWSSDWGDVAKTWNESWGSLPQAYNQHVAGLTGMMTAPFKDDGDFWGSTRMWADSALNAGSAVLGGTVGTIFAAPILNETTWLLDKAYRYGIARPISTNFLFAANSAREAYAQGGSSLSDFVNPLMSFNNYRKAWNDSEFVTPGQAIVYNTRLNATAVFGGTDEALTWAQKHDPKTPAGQATFNSANAEGWLKYTSGSIDFAANVLADPGHGASVAYKASKLRLVDKVADARYVMADKVHKEVNKPAYQKVKQVALDTKSPEEFGQLTMPDNPLRNRMQSLLWHAARVSDDVYADTYLVTRAMDPAAYDRLKEAAPAIYASFSDEFAAQTIADMDYQRGQLASTTGADVLRQKKFEAYVDSLWAGDGLFGQSMGVGVGAKMPRARLTSKLKSGYHSFVLDSAPIVVSALKRPLANSMPSQGWTQFIPARDNTALGQSQFKANVERASILGQRVLTDEETNRYVSWYGAATSDATRLVISTRVENLVLQRMLGRFGIKKDDLGKALTEINKWRGGVRRILNYERYFISDVAAKRAATEATLGRLQRAADAHAISDEAIEAVERGEIPGGFAAFPDVDGRLNLVVPDGELAYFSQSEPILRSQIASHVTMMDYRALSSALRWWSWSHPKARKHLPDADDVISAMRLKPEDEEALRANVAGEAFEVSPSGVTQPIKVPEAPKTDSSGRDIPLWRIGLAQAAKLRGWYDASITALDAVNTIWKTSALFRPAQMPRNLASDVALTIAEFGKLPVMMMAAQATPNVMRNFGARGKLRFEQAREFLTGRRASNAQASPRVNVQADVDIEVPGNLDAAVYSDIFSLSPSMMFASGRMGLDDYLRKLELIFESRAPKGPKFGTPRPEERKGKSAIPQVFVSSATQAMMAGQPGSHFKAPPPPPSKGLGSKGKRPSEVPGMTDTPFMPSRVGAPLFVEASWYRRFKAGEVTADQYRDAIVKAALSAHGKDLWRKAYWGMNVAKELVQKHFDRRQQPGYKDNPYAPGTLVIDPFTGIQPKVAMGDLRKNFTITNEATFLTEDLKGKFRREDATPIYLRQVQRQLVNFITLNADEILKPDTLLSLRVLPDGNISAGFAKAKAETIARGETIKAGAAQRLKNFRYDEILDAGHTGFRINLPGGKTLDVEGWAETDAGKDTQAMVSARDNPATQWGLLTENMEMEDMLAELGQQKPLRPNDAEYAGAWERAANAQLASDPVAQRVLEGKTVEEIDASMWDEGWGRRYMSAMGFRRVASFDHIKQIEAMVNTYVPHPKMVGDEKAAAAVALRQKVLAKTATFQDLLDVTDEIGLPREIHGASVDYVLGRHPLVRALNTSVNKIQQYINDMPVDKIARFPFMAMAYKQHATNMAQIAGHYFRNADAIPADVIKTVKDSAREKAYYDTRHRLYDTAQRNDLAYATRFLMPFSAAMMDSYIKYGRKIRENPMLLVQAAYYWDSFERNEMVQDENGYVLRKDGPNDKWYAVNPTTGEHTLVDASKVGTARYIQFQLPSALAKAAGKKYYGVDARPVVAINKDTMNVFLNLPGGGPLVALPANEFALDHPQFGENKLVKKFLLPFGPTANRTKVFLPSTVRSAWDAFVSEDGSTLSGHSAAIMQAELIGYGLGTRNEPPTFEEVRDKAQGLQFLRFASTFGSPAAFQLQSPYQPYIDAYRQLVAADPKTAADEFMRIHGDEFYAVTMSVTRNNAGLTATLESAEAYGRYKDLIAKYPDFGGLIVGSEGAGDFAKSVYEQQKDTPLGPGDPRTLREIMPLADSVAELNKKTAWREYSKMNSLITAALVDRGLKSLDNYAARDLKATRDAFIAANQYWMDPRTGEKGLSPWYEDFKTSEGAGMEKKLEAMWAIVKDPRLQKRDDIQGLAEYLAMRTDMQKEMGGWGFKSLNSQQARGLKNKWDQKVHVLVEANLAFADLWSRYLSNDSLEIVSYLPANTRGV